MREAGQQRVPSLQGQLLPGPLRKLIGESPSKLEMQFGPSLLRAGFVRMQACIRTLLASSHPNIIVPTMPSRPVGLGPALSLHLRVRPPAVRWRNNGFHLEMPPFIRCSSSSKHLPTSESRKAPNTEQLPHISEETASMANIMGGKGPDFGQGTLAQEVG